MSKPYNPYEFGTILKFTQKHLQNREDRLSAVRLRCDMQFEDALINNFKSLRCVVVCDPGGFYNYVSGHPNPVVYPMLDILERDSVITQTRRLTVRR